MIVSRLHVLCDLCQEPLCWPADDQGSDGMDVMFFSSIVDAEDTALKSGWGRINPDDDHVISPMQCLACRNRLAAMHAWIKQNRIFDGPV